MEIEDNKKVLLGKKGKEKYEGWTLPPDSWTTIQKVWIEDGQIKIWNRPPHRYPLITNNYHESVKKTTP